MRYVIFGGAGFLGTHLAERLTCLGATVVVVDRPERLNKLPQHECLEMHEARTLGNNVCRKVICRDDVVFHLWSETSPHTSNNDVGADLNLNLLPTVAMLERSVEVKIGRFIFASSSGVYGTGHEMPICEQWPTEPVSSYGIVKLATEKYLALYRRLYGLDSRVLRIGNAYGPGLPVTGRQNLIGALLRSAALDTPVHIWGNGLAKKDYVFSDDVVDAMVKVAVSEQDSGTLNIGTGRGTAIAELINAVELVTGKSLTLRCEDHKRTDPFYSVLDPSKTLSVLGWKAQTKLEEGLARTWHWLQQSLARPAGISIDSRI